MSYALIDNEVLQLCCAVRTEDISVVRILLEAGVNVNGQDTNGATALHTAVYNDCMDIVHQLIMSGADVNISNKNGQTALHVAASHGNVEIIRILIAENADIDTKTKYTETTALHLASQNGHTETVRTLIEHGANIDALDVIHKPADYYASNTEINNIFKDAKMEIQTENTMRNDQDVEMDLIQKYLQKLQDQQPKEIVENDNDSGQDKSVNLQAENNAEVHRENKHSSHFTSPNITSTTAIQRHAEPTPAIQTEVKPTLPIQTNVKTSRVHSNPIPDKKPSLMPTGQRTQRSRNVEILQKPTSNHRSDIQQKPGRVKFSQQHEKIMKMNVFDRLTRKKTQPKN